MEDDISKDVYRASMRCLIANNVWGLLDEIGVIDIIEKHGQELSDDIEFLITDKVLESIKIRKTAELARAEDRLTVIKKLCDM